MLGLRQLRSLSLGKRRWHPYLTILGVYLGLLLISRLSRIQLKVDNSASAVSTDQKDEKRRIVERSPPVPLEETSLRQLTTSFKAADIDANKLMSGSELAMAISRQTKQHIMHAMRSNFKVFFALDRGKKNGQVDWEEYYSHYLVDLLGLDKGTINNLEKNPATVSRGVKESISRLRAAWFEAARSNPEAVNIDEFLSLEHPESSHSLLMQRVEEVLANHDFDGDGKISRKEYTSHMFRDLSSEEIEERRKQFDSTLDVDHSGVAERRSGAERKLYDVVSSDRSSLVFTFICRTILRELLQFMDPKHLHWAREEAASLLQLADTNEDGSIDIEEMVAQSEAFLTSKLVSPQRSFHGEL